MIATEATCPRHNRGVDPLAVVRAALESLRAHAPSPARTITQQLARNLYLAPANATGDEAGLAPRSLARKLNQTLLALRLNRRRSQDEVLVLYLNHAYFGNLAYGVEAAAHAYFARPARDLDLAESRCCRPDQSPVMDHPYAQSEAAARPPVRSARLMARRGCDHCREADAARAEPLAFSERHSRSTRLTFWLGDAISSATSLGPVPAWRLRYDQPRSTWPPTHRRGAVPPPASRASRIRKYQRGLVAFNPSQSADAGDGGERRLTLRAP